MKEIRWDIVPNDGSLVLLTAVNLVMDEQLFIADFRDREALVYNPTGSFVGLTRTRGIRLGKKPLRLVNGIWLLDEDLEITKIHKNLFLMPDLVSLEMI